jgi:hypothetical protein
MATYRSLWRIGPILQRIAAAGVFMTDDSETVLNRFDAAPAAHWRPVSHPCGTRDDGCCGHRCIAIVAARSMHSRHNFSKGG